MLLEQITELQAKIDRYTPRISACQQPVTQSTNFAVLCSEWQN